MTQHKRGDVREDGLIYWSHNWWVAKSKFDELTEHTRKKMREYGEANKAVLLEKAKARYQKNKEAIKARAQEYYWKNRETILPKVRAYEKAHAEESRLRHKRFREAHPDIVIARRDAYKFRRNVLKAMHRRDNPVFAAVNMSRSRIWRYLFFGRSCREATRNMIGCSPEDFRKHIESLFDSNMSWGNYGIYWEVDHTIPLDRAKTVEDVLRLCHYRNLRPMRVEDNLAKSSK